MSGKKRNRISCVEISSGSTKEITLEANTKTLIIKNSNTSPEFMQLGFNETANSKIRLAAGDGIVLSLDDGTAFDGNRVYADFVAANTNNSGFLIMITELDEDCD